MLSHQEISELISNSAEGLPYTVKALVLELTKSLDIESGIIEIDSLQRLVRDMWVERTQGRKVEEVKKETIRSYLRTMHKCSRGLIQVITTKDKKIQVFFPLIKKAYENFVAQNKEYSDTPNNKNKGNLEQTRAVASQVVKTDTTQKANSSAPLDINNKNINKKINISNRFPVSVGFMPNPETISKAVELELHNVLEQAEIDRFITWNTTRNTEHTEDYWQHHYLNWLKNSATYQASKEQDNGTCTKPISTNSPQYEAETAAIDCYAMQKAELEAWVYEDCEEESAHYQIVV